MTTHSVCMPSADSLFAVGIVSIIIITHEKTDPMVMADSRRHRSPLLFDAPSSERRFALQCRTRPIRPSRTDVGENSRSCGLLVIYRILNPNLPASLHAASFFSESPAIKTSGDMTRKNFTAFAM